MACTSVLSNVRGRMCLPTSKGSLRHLTSTAPTSHPSRISPLTLPLKSNPVPMPIPQKVTLTSTELQRLHRLCALNPPLTGSDEETKLLESLSGLLGLMELVKSVDMDMPEGKEEREAWVRDLLTDGIGEIVIDGRHRASNEGESGI